MELVSKSSNKRLIIFLSLLVSLTTALIYQVASYGLVTKADVMPLTTTYVLPPRINSITPSTVVAGSTATEIVVTGLGFTNRSVIFWRRTSGQITTYNVSHPNQLRATIATSALTTPMQVEVVVANPDNAGYFSITSEPVYFTITPPPPPVLISIEPSSVVASGLARMITIYGNGFRSNSSASINGGFRPTTYISSSAIRINTYFGDTTTPGSYPIVVRNGINGILSNSIPLTVTPSTIPSSTITPVLPH